MKILSTIHLPIVQVQNQKLSVSNLSKPENVYCSYDWRQKSDENTHIGSQNVAFGSLFNFHLGDKKPKLSPEKLYRKNYSKLANYFIKQKLFNPDYIDEYSDKISTLAVLDYDSVIAKYNFYNKEVNAGCSYNVRLPRCFDILAESKLDTEGLETLCRLKSDSKNIDVNELMKIANRYKRFDSISTKEQTELIEGLDKPEVSFLPEQVQQLSLSASLMQIPYFFDLSKLESSKKMKEALIERQKNAPVHSISVDSKCFDGLFAEGGAFSYERLKDAFKGVDLDRYRDGMRLEYPREDFINDFKNVIVHLSPDDKAKVFSYFKFSIDEQNDIIGYPVPKKANDEGLPVSIRKEVIAAKRLVEVFMLQNTIKLDEKDKKLEDALNAFIKAFPEFVSIIGKKHHRGDTIDNHTLVDLKKCLENPMTAELSPLDQEVLFIATMFHDISKKQNKIDPEHPLYSAIYAKEIVKKAPISLDDKERVYELIKHSHWISSGVTDEEMAAIFRRKNDIKLATILAKADAEATGFENPIPQDRIEKIYALRDQIYKNGIPLFVSVFPEKADIPPDDDGVKIIDFSDKSVDLSKYGFEKGTKFSDLNFLCHSSTKSASELVSICDDSKEICLSSTLMSPAISDLLTEYNKGCNIILSSSNSNICLAGSMVGSTGCRRGFQEFKQYLYGLSYEGAMLPDVGIKNFREEVPGKLKKYFALNDDEYAELYGELDSITSVDEIKDVALSNGKTISASLIKEGVNNIVTYLHTQIENKKNEVVVFNPKVMAFVIKKDLYNKQERDEQTKTTINTAKENDIPIVLV